MELGEKPVKINDEIKIECVGNGSKGDGIGKIDGFVIFFQKGQKGKTYLVKIKDVRTSFAIGEIVGEV